MIGHSEAYHLLYNIYKTKNITEKEIKEIHRLLYYRIDEKNAGQYRTVQVIISGSEFMLPAPDKVPGLMKRFVKKIPSMREEHHPIEFAVLLHKEFIDILPFIDGNGRTARLLMNLALLQEGYAITIIPPILRSDYIQSLELLHKGDDISFTNFISTMVYESQKDYLRLIKSFSQ